MSFHIDIHNPPALGPIEKDRFIFCCSRGCGECQAVLVTMRTLHHTIELPRRAAPATSGEGASKT